ncbi:hypothetical protein [Arthrobacter sp. M4]|uniref:hypothetical protein n=1 Tax=Arthrobacter sp. M4 TaxID=218160 RepID=UPI001CDB90C8|nr:hypothetical protein [Arthrobacter sp. M4]MCA4131380.1 hypothetical protein [Arthrobacter sp. M4]
MTRRRLSGRQAAAGVASSAWLVLGLFFLSGCSQSVAASSTSSAGEQAAKVEKNATTGIAKITLSEKAINRLDLKTTTVQAGTAGAALTLPYEALLYDAKGATWVYTSPAPRVYQRQAVTVSRIEGNTVFAAAGPPAGTVIVTTAAAELFGAEFDTAH